jgi:hypothetical protein
MWWSGCERGASFIQVEVSLLDLDLESHLEDQLRVPGITSKDPLGRHDRLGRRIDARKPDDSLSRSAFRVDCCPSPPREARNPYDGDLLGQFVAASA